MKVHLAKKFTNGRITLKVAECGKKAKQQNRLI